MDKIGVCLFDDPKLASSGWASVAGETAKRISGAAELSSAEVWVTNVDFRTYRALSFHKAPHIFDTQYFRTSMRMLVKELGLEDDHKTAASVFSEIFTRTLKQAVDVFGLQPREPEYRFSSLLGGHLLSPRFRRGPQGPNAAEIQLGINHAYQANQAMFNRRPPQGSTAQVFTFPRERYARWLLSLPYPSGDRWKTIAHKESELVIGVQDGSEIPGTRAALQRLRKKAQTSAVFLRISVLSIDRFFQDFASFGVGGFDVKARRWATLPEVIEISRYSKISLMGGFQCPLTRLGLSDRLSTDARPFSFSRGLLLENAWVGLSGRINGSKDETALGAYMRAYDRLACNRVAEQFARYNVVIGSYGTGRVVAYVPENEKKAITQLALAKRVLPPLSMTKGLSLDGNI